MDQQRAKSILIDGNQVNQLENNKSLIDIFNQEPSESKEAETYVLDMKSIDEDIKGLDTQTNQVTFN